MKIHPVHDLDVDLAGAAAALQRELVARLRHPPLDALPRYVAGADISFSRVDPRLHAGVVVLELPSLEVVEERVGCFEARVPYVPGFLAFREVPALLPLFEALETTPGAVLCDGHGIAHPRGLGLAAHLGLFLGVPTVGCAKSPFVGEHDPVPTRRWSRRALTLEGRTLGAVLRTRAGVRPVYVSPGHLVDLEGAVRLVRATTGTVRLPEPTRQAHLLVNRARKAAAEGRTGRSEPAR